MLRAPLASRERLAGIQCCPYPWVTAARLFVGCCLKIGIYSVVVDHYRRGVKNHGALQPQIGPLIAALLPDNVEVELLNDGWEDPDWDADYDLMFISSLHADFDRARQVSHYWRLRGTKTVYGGILASTYPELCAPYFDSIAVGDPQGCIQTIVDDFGSKSLKPLYRSTKYQPEETPTPRFDLINKKHPVLIGIEATRGCPFVCDFCSLTGLGTRYHIRPPELVVRDIKNAQNMLRGTVPDYKLKYFGFSDNNLGGNPAHLLKLCDALEPLGLLWGSSISFNIISQPKLVAALSRAGCRYLFVGLESFNPAALSHMNKGQNNAAKISAALASCKEHGIMVQSGLVLNPHTDDRHYLESIPGHLKEAGLHMPNFVCFECPFPGTPFFDRVCSDESAQSFLPNAYLRDFSGYTLVVEPQKETTEQFIKAYRRLLSETFSHRAQVKKIALDSKAFVAGRRWTSMAANSMAVMYGLRVPKPPASRTYLAGTDTPPPESSGVPFQPGDFDSEEHRERIVGPMRVTDERGAALEPWKHASKVYEKGGGIRANA
jgi:hypothetical protein